MKLREPTRAEWVAAVLADFNSFLQDHAACEKKASAMALSLVAHYPDRLDLVRSMISVAQEELEHFSQVYRRMEARALCLTRDRQDPYVGALLKHVRTGRDEYFLDRLLLGAVIEARGCERFRMISESNVADDMRRFYQSLWRSEARHAATFLSLARQYHSEDVVMERLEHLLMTEADIVTQLPIRAALH